MKLLLIPLHAPNEKAHAQTQQQRRQDRTQNGSPNNLELIRLQQDHEQHNLHYRTHCSLEQDTEDLGEFASEFLTGETDEVGGGDHGDVVEDEDR